MSSSPRVPVGRRRFLKGAAAGAAALVANAAPAAATPEPQAAQGPRPAPPPNAQLIADTEAPRRSAARIVEHPASAMSCALGGGAGRGPCAA